MRKKLTEQDLIEQDAGGMEYCLWLGKVGFSPSTGYRYRRDGKVDTVNIQGREFILTEEIARFWERAKAGEFAKKPRGASARHHSTSSPLPARAQRKGGHNRTT